MKRRERREHELDFIVLPAGALPLRVDAPLLKCKGLKEGDPCPKCKKPLAKRAGHFHWRGRDFHGLVCDDCNALWNDSEDSFIAHVTQSAVESSDG